MSSRFRLVVDALRRMLPIYGVAAFVLFTMSFINSRAIAEGSPVGRPSEFLAWAMAACWFLAYSPTMVLEVREITRLPVSRREIWIARWWLAVCTPVMAIATAVGVAMLLPGVRADEEQLALFIVYGALYGGCFAALAAVFPLQSIAPVVRPTWRVVVRVIFLVAVIPLGGSAAPLWFAKYLPRTFDQMHGPFSGWLIAAAGVTVASYFHRPQIVPRPGRAHLAQKASARTTGSPSPNRLTGMPLLYWKEGRKALTIYGSFLAVGLLYWWIFESGPKAVGDTITLHRFADFLADGGALVFARSSGWPTGHFPAIVMLIAIGSSDFGLAGELRGLRAFPISVSRLAAMLTSFSVLSAALLWVTLLAAHLVATGDLPDTLRPDLFCVVAGVMALGGAIQFVLPGSQAVKLLASGTVTAPALLVFSLARTAATPAPAMIAGGGVAVALSWMLTTRTLRRSRRIYKRPSPLASFLPEHGR